MSDPSPRPADPASPFADLLAEDSEIPSLADYPETHHGGPSNATLLLGPLGISAAKFVRASEEKRTALLDELFDRSVRRLIGQTIVCSCVALGCLVALRGGIRSFALAGCIIKAAGDLARYFRRRKVLNAAAELTEDDLELTAPREN
jgi:hypothetical protein